MSCILVSGGPSSPAGQLSHLCIEGSFTDAAKVKELSSISDVVTTEIEQINADALAELESTGHAVQPTSQTLRIIQDKYLQKVHLAAANIPLPEFMSTPDVKSAEEAGLRFGYPFMLKNRKLAYDGKGNAVVRSPEEVAVNFGKLGGNEIYAEKWAPFTKELAVMVVRTKEGVVSYPVVETVQTDNVCHIVTSPAQISATALVAAEEV
jgi:phosphoribosylaminoimidazole carboxylase